MGAPFATDWRGGQISKRAALDQIKTLALPKVGPIAGPAVVVAGSCDASLDPQLQIYRKLVLDAFRNSTGTIISGGTTAGISGLMGEVQQAHAQTLRTIGYIPQLISADVTVDGRYSQIRKTDGNGFSALEPLQYWIDLLASGILPGQVKLLGFGGDVIAATEYKIALALGASVGLIEGSGRAAAELELDVEWNGGRSLLRLPADAMTLRAFVGTAMRG